VLGDHETLQKRQKLSQDDKEALLKKSITSSATCSGAIDLMLAHKYEAVGVDPTGWYMSEKLDGVRCFWNGKKLYSRAGNEFFAP